MREINLLPREFRPEHKFSKFASGAEKFLIFLTVIYLIITASAIGFSYYLKKKVDEVNKERGVLTAELKALTSVETKTVLIKDRVKKFNQLLGKDIELDELSEFKKIYLARPADLRIEKISFQDEEIRYEIKSSDIVFVSAFLKMLEESDFYKGITVGPIIYKADEGYSILLVLHKG